GAGVAGFADEVVSDAVAVARFDMPVEAVVAGVQLSADEPFCERRMPFKDMVEFLKPGKLTFGEIAPERFRVFGGPIVKLFIRGIAGYIGARNKVSAGWIY